METKQLKCWDLNWSESEGRNVSISYFLPKCAPAAVVWGHHHHQNNVQCVTRPGHSTLNNIQLLQSCVIRVTKQ